MNNFLQHAEDAGSVHRAAANHTAQNAMAYPAVPPVLQKKVPEEEELQMKPVARFAKPEEEELQLKAVEPIKNNIVEGLSQRKENIVPPKVNRTGIPDNLKAGIENLSGIALDDVKVHYNSSQPAQLDALAYAQGTDIHIGPGQERHLPHEAWHVVQQKQGRVRPTIQAKGIAINGDKGLEKEADMMGAEATKTKVDSGFNYGSKSPKPINNSWTVQAKKTTPFNLGRKYPPKFHIEFSEYKGLGQQEYKNFIYNKLKASYDKNLVSGTRYWGKLETAIANFKAKDNTEFLEKQATKHLDYNSRFEKNYASNTRNHWWYSENVDIGSSGLEQEGGKVNPDKDVPYTNSVSFEDNSISANHNYAERDEARKQDTENKGKERYKDRGLPNSEVLWQQYKLAAKNQFWFFKDSRANELMKGLSAVKRRQVQNASTMMTILFALPDGLEDLQAVHNWQAGTEEFMALLGTPNCSGAAFLLTDHVDELDGKSITEIDLLGGADVNLDIKMG